MLIQAIPSTTYCTYKPQQIKTSNKNGLSFQARELTPEELRGIEKLAEEQGIDVNWLIQYANSMLNLAECGCNSKFAALLDTVMYSNNVL